MPKFNLPADEEIVKDLPPHFVAAWKAKFLKGKAEHGGNIMDKKMLPNAIDEVLDLISYLYVLQCQIQTLKQRSKDAHTDYDLTQLKAYIDEIL